MSLEFNPRVQRIPSYPVASGYAHPGPLIRLASNESPEPPLGEVVDAITATLSGLNRYPDPSNAALRRRLSERYGVPSERIAIGNGSCDLLLAAGDALLEPGSEVVYAWPSFSVYPQVAAGTGATAVTVDLDADGRHDLVAMQAEVTAATRLVIICNPNNPTSTAVPTSRIAEFLEQVPPHVCVILDEAYCEFKTFEDPDAALDLLGKHRNLVVLRTFSKVYGLCGLRVGFALCATEEFPHAVDRIRPPFYCNAAAQAAAIEALAHQDAVAQRVARTVAARIEMDERLRSLGLDPADSEANFCWFDLGDGRDEEAVVGGLAERGILVRAGAALGRPGALRVTYGTPAENRSFLDVLSELL